MPLINHPKRCASLDANQASTTPEPVGVFRPLLGVLNRLAACYGRSAHSTRSAYVAILAADSVPSAPPVPAVHSVPDHRRPGHYNFQAPLDLTNAAFT